QHYADCLPDSEFAPALPSAAMPNLSENIIHDPHVTGGSGSGVLRAPGPFRKHLHSSAVICTLAFVSGHGDIIARLSGRPCHKPVWCPTSSSHTSSGTCGSGSAITIIDRKWRGHEQPLNRLFPKLGRQNSILSTIFTLMRASGVNFTLCTSSRSI